MSSRPPSLIISSRRRQRGTFTPSPSPPPKRQRLTAPKKRKHTCDFVLFSPSSTPPPVIAVNDEEFVNLFNCDPPPSPAVAAAVKELLESIGEEWGYFCLKKKALEASPSFLEAQTQRKMRVLMSLRELQTGAIVLEVLGAFSRKYWPRDDWIVLTVEPGMVRDKFCAYEENPSHIFKVNVHIGVCVGFNLAALEYGGKWNAAGRLLDDSSETKCSRGHTAPGQLEDWEVKTIVEDVRTAQMFSISVVVEIERLIEQ
ncbi:unnamed protein product [Dovyalis caffra]|uniref:Uncharacterized protein n=1 Tax=Dovyalis caffra TaxID=77055 RepID=A0AAV1RWY0_9ROSI|nr:unnamed protein product [Dovyalis caffra]